MYEAAGGRLSRESEFGDDPLKSSPFLISQRELFYRQGNQEFSFIHANVANGNPTYFESAIVSFIDITQRLSQTL